MAASRFFEKKKAISPLFWGLIAFSFFLHLLFFLWPTTEEPSVRPEPIAVQLLPSAQKTTPKIPAPTTGKPQQASQKTATPKPAPKKEASKTPAPKITTPPPKASAANPKPAIKPSLSLDSKLSQIPTSIKAKAFTDQAELPTPTRESSSTEEPDFKNLQQVQSQSRKISNSKLPQREAGNPGEPQTNPSNLSMEAGGLRDLQERAHTPTPMQGSGNIQGEVANRKLLFKPRPPLLNLNREVTIILNFRVLPDGSVDSIKPIVKGDAELEEVAVQLLRQYRFEPIPLERGSQEGVIHFTLLKGKAP